MMAVAVLMTLCVSAQRHTESLDFGWEFRLNDEGDWRKVDVPHDFQIEQPWVEPVADKSGLPPSVKTTLSSRAFKTAAKGYYRLH